MSQSRRQQAAEILTSYDFGLAGLDDVMLDADGTMLGCFFCGYNDGLGAFIGQPLTASAVQDARKVVAVAATPGTEATRVVAGRLARKGLELGKIAFDRAQVALKARQKRDELAAKVKALQPRVEKLLASSSSKDWEVGAALKQDQLSAARAAVRLEKVNAVASGLAENAAAQAVLSQQIAGGVVAGKPALVATLSSMYNKLGRSSASMQRIRQEQIVNSARVLDQDKVRALLAQKRALLQQIVDIDVLLTLGGPQAETLRKKKYTLHAQVAVVNAEVKKLIPSARVDSFEGGALGELAAKPDMEAIFAAHRARMAEKDKEPILDARFENARKQGWIQLTPKSDIRVVNVPGIPGLDTVQVFGNLDLQVVQAASGRWESAPAYPGGRKLVPDPLQKGQLLVLEQRLGRKLSPVEKQLLLYPAQLSQADLAKGIKEIEKKVKQDYRRMVEKSGSLYRVPGVSDVLNTAKAVAQPVVSVAKAAAQTVALPATTAVKLVTKGPAAAVGNIAKTMENNFNTVRKAAGELFVGLPCKFATSTVGKAALQVGAAAVGTAIGGPAGTVAGAVAANRAQDLSKSVCGGLDKIGLTRGDFRTSKLGTALKQTALGIGKNLVDPKKLLKDASTIGTSLVGAGLPTDLLNQMGGEQLKKLGLDVVSKSISLPGGAANLLKAVGVPTDVTRVLKAAGLPSDPTSVLRAVGVPSAVKDVLKKAGVPTDLPTMLKATKVLQQMKLPVSPDNLARAMGVPAIPIPGVPGKLRLPAVLPPRLNIDQIKAEASRRLAMVRREQTKKAVAQVQTRARSLIQQALQQPAVVFPAGSPAAALVPYV